MNLKEKLKEIRKRLPDAICPRKPKPVEVIHTGSHFLNEALGVGGYPRGRFIEIYGPESSGKTTLALHAMANVKSCAFIDMEHTFDHAYAERIGVNMNNLIVAQPDSGEDAMFVVQELSQCDDLDLIVLDSVAALVCRAEIEGDPGDSHIGLQARLMSASCRKLGPALSNSGVCMIFINQLRANIGAFGHAPKTITTGGNALKFYASVRLEIRRIGTLKHKDEAIGNRVRVKVSKNKVAPPFKTAEFDLIFGKGIQNELFEVGIADGRVTRAGAWFMIGDHKVQGKLAAQEYVNINGLPDKVDESGGES